MALITSKTPIFLMLTLILLIFVAPAISGFADEAVKRSMLVHAEQIAGIMNVLQSSPSDTSHIYFLPKGECELAVNKLSVNLASGKQSAIKEIVTTGTSIPEKSIKCKSEDSKAVYLKRCRNEIIVDEKPGCS